MTKTRVHHTSPGLFTQSSPRKIADSLLAESRDSAHAVKRITFEINHAGRNLTKTRRTLLKRAKQILMHGAGSPARTAHSRRSAAHKAPPARRAPAPKKTHSRRAATTHKSSSRTKTAAPFTMRNDRIVDARWPLGQRGPNEARRSFVGASEIYVGIDRNAGTEYTGFYAGSVKAAMHVAAELLNGLRKQGTSGRVAVMTWEKFKKSGSHYLPPASSWARSVEPQSSAKPTRPRRAPAARTPTMRRAPAARRRATSRRAR